MARFRIAIFVVFAILLAGTVPGAEAAVGDIITVAGGPIRDGVAGIQANVLYPAGVAVDGAGNIYIADQGNNRIRKIGPDGIISTVAGNATGGYSGDDGPATSASLRMPTGVALDAAGNLYIADQGNNRIRKVSGGVMTTLAGTGATGSSGDGGPAISATLNSPFGIAVDKTTGKVYFSDQGNHRVRMVAPDTGIITTVAGTGAAAREFGITVPTPATSVGLNNPQGVAVAANGDLYIVDKDNNRILKVTNPGPDGNIISIAGDGNQAYSGDNGPATAAQLWRPSGVAVLADDVYIADRDNQRIRKVSAGLITTIAGNGTGGYSGDGGPATQAMLKHPTGIAVDPVGNVYWTESGSDAVRKVPLATGIVSTVAGGGSRDSGVDGKPGTETSFKFPWSVALKGGDVYITDWNRLRMLSARDGTITTAAGTGVGGSDDGPATSATMGIARGVTVDEATGNVYIADTGINRIRMLSAGKLTTIAGTGVGDYTGDGGPATSATMNSPSAVACDGAGNIYFADEGNNRVRKISSDGKITTVAGNGEPPPDPDIPVPAGPATAIRLNRPSGVAVDKSGNLYIADMNYHRIVKVAEGWLTTVAGTKYPGTGNDAATSANLYYPAGVAVDGAGTLFIADQYNHRIRKVSNNIITTIAGNGMWNYAGDNGPAIEASLAYPNALAVDRNGNLYIADRRNKCVRKVFGVAAAVPPPPTSVSATAGDAKATVTFPVPASDGGSAITGYTVASHPAGGIDSNAGSTALSHVITGLTNGVAYTFTVTATNAVGTGDPSLPSDSVTPATVPGAPVIGVAAPGNTAATVKFTPPASDGGSAITGYTVQSDPAGGVDSGAGTTALSHVVTGLSNGTPYTFTVTATNGVGTGAPSAPSNAVTPATVPGAPVIRTAVGSNGKATVTFSGPASNGGSPITGYTVTSSPAGGVDLYAGKTGLTHIVTGLRNGTRYTFTVRASNAVGPGEPSALSGVVIPSALPGAPVMRSARGYNAQAVVTFSPPASNGGSLITGYRVTSHPAGGVDLHAGKTGLTHIVVGLKNGTGYYFTVTATNAVGTGPSSAISNKVIPATLPGAPVIGKANAGIRKATITFSPPASNGGSPIRGYKVFSNPAGGIDLYAGRTTLTHIVTGLKNGTAYTFKVAAANAVGTGPASAPSNRVITATVPGAPIIGTAKGGNGKATVTFRAPLSNGGAAITGYKVVSNPAGGVDLYAGRTALTHTITRLKNGVAYTFTVTATNAIGTGPPSAPSNKVIPAAVASAAVMQTATADAAVPASSPQAEEGSGK